MIMPTQSEMRLPIPTSPYEFENICLDYIRFIYPYLNAQRYGRIGQSQYGIDIYGGNFEILVQCKNYYISTVTNASQKATELKRQISIDYSNAKQHFPNCKQFIVMTTFECDGEIQEYVPTLGTDINILFWNAIEEFLCGHMRLLQKYYPSLAVNNSLQSQINSLNRMIAISNSLQTYAEYFYSNSISNYAPFHNEVTDNSMYNNYVVIYNTVVELTSLYSGINLQTMNSSIGDYVKIIQSFIPSGYEDGGWGGHLLVLPDILRSFNSIERLNLFKNTCEQLILEIQRIYSK